MRDWRRQQGHDTSSLEVTATESLIDSALKRRPRLLKRLTQCGIVVYHLRQQRISPASTSQPTHYGDDSSSYLIINYQQQPSRAYTL